MPTELEELVGFLGSPQPQIRQIALEHLVGYSQGPQAAIFKASSLAPVKNLKLVVRDIPPRAKLALTILVNLSDDAAVRSALVGDKTFLALLLAKITDASFVHADLACMLLANMAKSDAIAQLLALKLDAPAPEDKDASRSAFAMDQLMDCFVKGADRKLNKDADYDYLAYVFADVSRLAEGRRYFVTRQEYDGVLPVEKLVVFTEHRSIVRRKGVASTIKNCCFDVACHEALLDEDRINILPYLLLPIMGPEEYSDEDTDGMPSELQLQPPDKTREPDVYITKTHVESLLLLATTRHGRDVMRCKKVYPIIRATHLAVEDDGVTEACDRLVQLLLRDEPPEDVEAETKVQQVEDEEEDDDDDKVVEIL